MLYKSSVWFTLGSEDETARFVTLELFSTRLPVKVFKALNGRQFYILSKFHNIEKFQCHKTWFRHLSPV